MILYTTNCAKCNVLEKKLIEKKLDFDREEIYNPEKFIDLGLYEAPILYTNDNLYLNFSQAIEYINSI